MILTAIGAAPMPNRTMLDALTEAIANKRTLLILDNCEHMVNACARVVERLLRTCPNLRVLTTSREVLMIPGEMTWHVPPLSTPDPSRLSDDPLSFESVRLFVERAKTAQPNFALTPETVKPTAHICARLDGIPLALELAAALMQTFTVHEIAARLDQRFVLSVSGYRTAEPRHQTLNSTVEWSYNLLPPEEQRLLARLSVFVGGWTAEAAQAVCGDAQADVLPLLHQLAQKSLVVVDQAEGGTGTRYRLLRTIRDYAAERLMDQGETEATRVRHFNYFAQLAKSAGAELLGPNHHAWIARVDADYNNIRAALTFSKGQPELVNTRLSMAVSLMHFWGARGYINEGLAWMREAMSDEGKASLPTRARMYEALISLNMEMGEWAECERLFAVAEPLVELCLAQGDKPAAAYLMGALISVFYYRNDLKKVKELAERQLQLFESLGGLRGIGFARNGLASLAISEGDYETAVVLLEDNVRFFQQIGMAWGLCVAYNMRVWMADKRNDLAQMRRSLERVVELAEQEGFIAFLHHGYYALEHSDSARAIQLTEALLERHRNKDDSVVFALGLHQLGRMYLNAQQPERAVAPLDEALAMWRRLGIEENQGVGLAWSLIDRGQVARLQGDLDLALQCLSESIKLFSTSSYEVKGGFPLLYRGHVRLAQSDLDGALEDFRQCLREVTKQPKGWQKLVYGSLAAIGEVARLRGNTQLAAKLLAVAAAKALMPYELQFNERMDYERIIAATEKYKQDPVFAAAWQAGEQLTLDDAIVLALDALVGVISR